METETRLQRAEAHIFSTALPDSGSRLGRANMRYGLAKIHWVQEQLGMRPDATFISAPDFTVTRNATRWQSGFGYGGMLTWGSGDRDLMFLDSKPNGCGILVAGIETLPSMEALLTQVHELKNDLVEIDGIPVQWDFGKGNHYVDIFRVETLGETTLPPYAFMMHLSGGELRSDSDHGPGLYWEYSQALQAKMEVFDTPFGPLRVLCGDEARAYYDFYQHVDAFIKKRRFYAGQTLFGDFELINNEAHQGLIDLNRHVLGCYHFSDKDLLYPVGLRPDLPSYLVCGKPNLSSEMMENLGFKERARRFGVFERVKTANLLPHGGGYTFPHILEVVADFQLDGERYFEVDLVTGTSRQLVSNIRNLPYEYRGRDVLTRTLELEMAELAAKLIPVYVLKV